MTDLTTEVTVTIHGTEMDLIAEGDEICPSRSRMLGSCTAPILKDGVCISRTERRFL